MKYVVMRGKEDMPGLQSCTYCIFDKVEFDDTKNQVNEMRKYSYRVFHKMGASAKTMRSTVYRFEKNIRLGGGNGEIFAEKVNRFDHTKTFLIFVPAKCFEF